tara:strand:- start:496 stop:948 length:453 start_codon:yes stop_codon:yes gene_type:complete
MPALSLVSPLGPLTVTQDGGEIIGLEWRDGETDHTPLLDAASAQLARYFQGALGEFDLPLKVRASAAQQAVCAAMRAIPTGETRTYGALAKDLGLPAQAIGQLCGANPIPILIPCHRVLGASTLGGFSAPGRVETKVWLLKHERAGGLLI